MFTCRAIATAVLASLFIVPSVACAGTINGQVNFSGTPPEMPLIKLSADPACSNSHNEPPRRQDVVVNRNKTLKNVIVYLEDAPDSAKSVPITTESVILDQRGCMYEPHVFAIRIGQPLEIINSDSTVHNIHTQSKVNDRFNASMLTSKVPHLIRKFDKVELPVPIKCDVHPWMLAWAGVFDHPYFAVTGDDGTFSIKDVPAGQYTLAAWHERYGIQKTPVKVIEGSTPAEASFAYSDSTPSAKP